MAIKEHLTIDFQIDQFRGISSHIPRMACVGSSVRYCSFTWNEKSFEVDTSVWSVESICDARGHNPLHTERKTVEAGRDNKLQLIIFFAF